MQGYITRGRLQVAEQLDNFINEQALPGTGIDKDTFWQGAETLFEKSFLKIAHIRKRGTASARYRRLSQRVTR